MRFFTQLCPPENALPLLAGAASSRQNTIRALENVPTRGGLLRAVRDSVLENPDSAVLNRVFKFPQVYPNRDCYPSLRFDIFGHCHLQNGSP